MLERDGIWNLMDNTSCKMYERPLEWTQKATVAFQGGRKIEAEVQSARGVDPELSNEETVAKCKGLTNGVISDGRRDEIERLVLGLVEMKDLGVFIGLLETRTENLIA
jgi:aconitate decarboxylase